MTANGQQHERTALILYGSETGNAHDVADELGRITERLHFLTRVSDLDSVDTVSFVTMLPLSNEVCSLHSMIESIITVFGCINCYRDHRARGFTCQWPSILEELTQEAIIFGLLRRR